jgi:hypothetical protein
MSCCGKKSKETKQTTNAMPPQLQVKRTTPAPAPVSQVLTQKQNTIVVTDNVLFRWARIVAINRLFPILHGVRNLEYIAQSHNCNSCKSKPQQIDRTPLEKARKELATCSEEIANLVKQGAGVSNYTVGYLTDSGTYREVTR